MHSKFTEKSMVKQKNVCLSISLPFACKSVWLRETCHGGRFYDMRIGRDEMSCCDAYCSSSTTRNGQPNENCGAVSFQRALGVRC